MMVNGIDVQMMVNELERELAEQRRARQRWLLDHAVPPAPPEGERPAADVTSALRQRLAELASTWLGRRTNRGRLA